MLEKRLWPNSLPAPWRGRLVSITLQVTVQIEPLFWNHTLTPSFKMESWDPRQVKSCLLTPHHHHLWPQEMPFKNLHRRRSGLTPKTKGILSHSNTNTTTYACTLTHSQPYMHAYTHTNRHNSSKSFEPFFFPQSTTTFPMDEKRAHNWNLVLSGTNFTSKQTTVQWWVWLWGFGGGGQAASRTNSFFVVVVQSSWWTWG